MNHSQTSIGINSELIVSICEKLRIIENKVLIIDNDDMLDYINDELIKIDELLNKQPINRIHVDVVEKELIKDKIIKKQLLNQYMILDTLLSKYDLEILKSID